MSEPSRILVAGATGQVGGLVARKLLAAGVPVRAIGRNADKLAALAAAGAETMAADLRDRDAMTRACAGIGQVFTSVNNVMGRGGSSPLKVDVPAHQSLCAAARAAGVRRLVYLSAWGLEADNPADFFRLKVAIEETIRTSGIPYVLLRPTAFIEVWVGMLLDGMRRKGVAVIFGDGKNPSTYISVQDVAEFAVRILAREEIRNEVVEVGGPSTLGFEDVVRLLETRLGLRAKRRRIPVPLLRWGGLMLRPLNEVAARLMRMSYFVATSNRQFRDWQIPAERFGISPMSVEEFVETLPR